MPNRNARATLYNEECTRKETIYGQCIAPGCLTFSMAEGLTVQTRILHTNGMGFVGLEKMKLFAPLMPGETIMVEIEVLDKRNLTSREGGIVRYQHRVRNQKGETVMDVLFPD
jgi:acyl dehydratase